MPTRDADDRRRRARVPARYPEAAIIFDNLHSMHDVICDILADTTCRAHASARRSCSRRARYRDDTSSVMTVAEWRRWRCRWVLPKMGGPAVGDAAPARCTDGDTDLTRPPITRATAAHASRVQRHCGPRS